MKHFKKTLKLLGLVILIVLTSFGVGLVGGVPVSSSNKKEDTIHITIELVETDEDKTTLNVFDIK